MRGDSMGLPIFLLGVGALLLGSIASGCCSHPTRIASRYGPLHPAEGVNVQFDIQATDVDGIQALELFIYEYQYVVTEEGAWTTHKREGGRWGSVKKWEYSVTTSHVEESHVVQGFPNATVVKFLVQATDVCGNKGSETWHFAAGTWPFGSQPVPLWINGEPKARIDVAFVADRTDYERARDMLGDLEYLIFDGYHQNNSVIAGKKLWQFYYSPEMGTISDYNLGKPYNLEIPKSVPDSAIIDHAAVIHRTEKRDWARDGNFGTEPVHVGTAVHESAHVAFSLADEYRGGSHFTVDIGHHNNIWGRQASEAYNRKHKWPAGDTEWIEGNWYRPEPSRDACIMLDDGDTYMPDFARTCRSRIALIYDHLEGF